MKLRILSLLTLVALLVSFAVACKPVEDTPAGTTEAPTETPTGTVEPPLTPTDVRVFTMNGTTGFGMAKLMEDAANGVFKTEKYTFEVKTDFAKDVLPALINGDADIAAIPTNGASVAYNKTQGGVKVLAVNTLGCLYVIGKDAVNSLEELAAKEKVQAPAQNPTFILKYLYQKNGLSADNIANDYTAPADLAAAVASGKVDYAVLPEPMITVAKNQAAKKGTTVVSSLDLTAEWDRLDGMQGKLVQGCVVVRTAFLEAHPEAVANFLTAYEASVNYLLSHADDTAKLIVRHGIFAQEAVAKAAIPKCNIAFVAGDTMKAAMDAYLKVLFGIAPASIGGKVPDDAFYYTAK